MPIQRKLLAGYAIACLIVLAQGWLLSHYSQQAESVNERARRLATAQDAVVKSGEVLFQIQASIDQIDDAPDTKHSSLDSFDSLAKLALALESQQANLSAAVSTLHLDFIDQVAMFSNHVDDFHTASRNLHKAARQNEHSKVQVYLTTLFTFADRSVAASQTIHDKLQQEVDVVSKYREQIASKSTFVGWIASGLAVGFLSLFALIFAKDDSRLTLLEEARQLQANKEQERKNQGGQDAVQANPAIHNHDNSAVVDMPIDIDASNFELNDAEVIQQVLSYYEDLEQALEEQEETSRILAAIDLDDEEADLATVRENLKKAIEQSQRSTNRVSTAIQSMKSISLSQPHVPAQQQTAELATSD